MQVKTFDNVNGDTLQECNDFLKTIKASLIVSVSALYNTILKNLAIWCISLTVISTL